MQRGCCFCDPPPIPFGKQGILTKQKVTWS
jgi:hypothetical protein